MSIKLFSTVNIWCPQFADAVLLEEKVMRDIISQHVPVPTAFVLKSLE